MNHTNVKIYSVHNRYPFNLLSATCTPSCQNGGQCISHDVCQCAETYRGKQCQYSVEVCAPSKMNFNGAINCSGDSEQMRCVLSCPENIPFHPDTPPAAFYACSYELGVYSPSPVPQCKYRKLVCSIVQAFNPKSVSKHFLCIRFAQPKAFKSFRAMQHRTHSTNRTIVQYHRPLASAQPKYAR